MKLELNLQLLNVQILTSNVQVLILCLSYFITIVFFFQKYEIMLRFGLPPSLEVQNYFDPKVEYVLLCPLFKTFATSHLEKLYYPGI